MNILRLSCVAFLALSNGLETCTADPDALASDLLEWLHANGAYINEKLAVRHLVPDDPSSPRGIFTTEDLDAGETVCSIPPKLIIKSREELTEGLPEDMSYCGTIKAVKEAMAEGDKNTPYGRYLRSQPEGYTAKFWSEAGRNLLAEMLKSTRTDQLTAYDELPPHGVNGIFEELEEECHGDTDDPAYLHSAMVVWARADYEFMVPFYDMLNHSNRRENVKHKFLYTKSDNIRKKGYALEASEKIEAGGELFLSYNRCRVCGEYIDWFGTPEMFLQFGFVESMPQRWLFDFARVKFDLDWEDGDESTGKVVVNFLVPPSLKGMRLLQEELTRLESFSAKVRGRNFEVPKYEWESLWQYHDALHDAISAAIKSDVALSDDVWNQDDDWWVKDGTLKATDTSEHYVLPTKKSQSSKEEFIIRNVATSSCDT